MSYNGVPIQNLEFDGWGSFAKFEFEQETGKVVKAERNFNKDDRAMIHYYTTYLKQQFDKMKVVEEFETLTFGNLASENDGKPY